MDCAAGSGCTGSCAAYRLRGGFLGEQFLQRCPGRACQCQAAAASDSAAEQKIHAAFTVCYADGTSEEFTLEAQAGQTLAEALQAAGLISAEEAEAGFVTEVNGVKADFNKDQSWWCLTDASGEATTVGIGDIQLQDGDAYAFTYTK